MTLSLSFILRGEGGFGEVGVVGEYHICGVRGDSGMLSGSVLVMNSRLTVRLRGLRMRRDPCKTTQYKNGIWLDLKTHSEGENGQ